MYKPKAVYRVSLMQKCTRRMAEDVFASKEAIEQSNRDTRTERH